MMATVYLGLGSNVGDREGNIRKALGLLAESCEVKRVSSLYETEPLGYRDQGWFLNAAVEVECDLQPKELMHRLKTLEKRLGRKETFKYGPRIIDVDILFYDNVALDADGLVIPHPRLHERLFVLEPLNELCPDRVHPLIKRTVSELRSGVKSIQEVRLYG